jgi:hypothetical protein
MQPLPPAIEQLDTAEKTPGCAQQEYDRLHEVGRVATALPMLITTKDNRGKNPRINLS